MNENIVRLQSFKRAMGWYTAQCKMPFCAKTVVKESCSFELACLKKMKKKKEERKFGHLATFWFGTFMMLFHATRHVVGHENT